MNRPLIEVQDKVESARIFIVHCQPTPARYRVDDDHEECFWSFLHCKDEGFISEGRLDYSCIHYEGPATARLASVVAKLTVFTGWSWPSGKRRIKL